MATSMPHVTSPDRLRRSFYSNGLGVPKARSAATHTPSLLAASSSGATREGLSAGRLNARASTRMGRGTSGLTLPAALRLLRRLAESQWSVQLQAVVHLYIYTPRAEQRAPQAAQPSPPYGMVCHAIPYHTIPYHTIPYHTIPYLTLPYHHTIPYHIIPYHTIPYHAIPYHAIPCHTIPFHTTPYHIIPCHTMSYPAIPYHTIPYHALPYHTIPHHTIPYDTIPYHTTPWHTMSHHTIPHHTVPCLTIPYHDTPDGRDEGWGVGGPEGSTSIV